MEKREAKQVLVTGATGRIGRIVVQDLLARGFYVKATSSKSVLQNIINPKLKWEQFDFIQDQDYEGLISGCDAIVHLAAEIGDINRMQRINAFATDMLSKAAESAGTKMFCYVSTVSVYGSGKKRSMREDETLLTVDRDIRFEYLALDYVRMYGRTKLMGEISLKNNAKQVRYTIFRPSVVVDISDLIAIRDWSVLKRYWLLIGMLIIFMSGM
uniref:NAD-dependent epimerase/dehydratase family protein n=1 Tax=Methylobacterium sp. B34 TaxID=95563 RepID=UPI001FCB7DD6|nr:NAD-dependent epimerase/dehydratase family protein [Methylobacterium sp. B34]